MADQSDADLKSIELLYDYTKFHVGVYLTLGAATLTLAVGDWKGFLAKPQ